MMKKKAIYLIKRAVGIGCLPQSSGFLTKKQIKNIG